MAIPAAYGTVVLIWATTPLAIKWSSVGIGVAGAAAGRMLLGAMLATALVLLLRVDFPWHKRAQRSYLVASLGVFGAMSLVYWSSQYVASGLISVMFGMAPILSGLLAYWILNERDLSPLRILALLGAISGLAMVFSGELTVDASALPGLISLVGATFLFSLSAVLVKRFDCGVDPLAHTAGTLLYSLPGYILLWFVMESGQALVFDTRGVVATIYLALFGSVIGFVAYYYVLQRLTTATVQLIPLITPVLALMLGAALEDEQLSRTALFGTGLILTSLAIYQSAGWWQRRGQKVLPNVAQ
ncbi:MAG: DMT family transporter [Salinisphaeraceae bacterium]|nr:DMT family transporter [Salinisphaeraceae bacterium]